MADPIISQLQASPGDPPTTVVRRTSISEGFVAESLNLIRKVIAGRRSIARDDVSDIAQDVALRLWKWRTKFEDKSSHMADVDWKSFTARTAHNEVNRNLSNRNRQIEVSLDDFDARDDTVGASSAETFLLVETVWQGICKLSRYQRQALLFSSVDLVLYLLQFGVDEDALLRELELSRTAWESIAARMPLADAEIAEIANLGSERKRTKTTANAVKKARFDARKRLKELMNK